MLIKIIFFFFTNLNGFLAAGLLAMFVIQE